VPVILPAAADRTFVFNPPGTGTYALSVRPLLFGDYAADWGRHPPVTAVQAAVVQLLSFQPGGLNEGWLDFSVGNGVLSNFDLWSTTNLPAGFSPDTNAAFQALVPGSQYRAVIPATDPARFYQIRGSLNAESWNVTASPG